jgi:hypothetical protein
VQPVVKTMKPLYKILIIAAVVIIAIVGVYFLWSSITASPEPQPGAETGSTTLPTGGEAATGNEATTTATASTTNETGGVGGEGNGTNLTTIKKLSEGPIFDFWSVNGTEEVFYMTPTGKVMSLKEGPDLDISTQEVGPLNRIEPNGKGDRVLAAFGDPKSPQWGIYDAIDKVWRPLPEEITNATWKDDSSLIATVRNGNDINLDEVDITKNPPATKTIIKDLRLRDVRLTYKAPQFLFISELPSINYQGRLWRLDLKTNALTLIKSEERGLYFRWTNDRNVAFSFSAPSNFRILDGNAQEIEPVAWTAIPEKCTAVATSSVFCFVPRSLPKRMPDEYLEKSFYSIDDLIEISLTDGRETKLVSSGDGDIPIMDAKNPTVVGNKFYFINRYDDSLYQITLVR